MKWLEKLENKIFHLLQQNVSLNIKSSDRDRDRAWKKERERRNNEACSHYACVPNYVRKCLKLVLWFINSDLKRCNQSVFSLVVIRRQFQKQLHRYIYKRLVRQFKIQFDINLLRVNYSVDIHLVSSDPVSLFISLFIYFSPSLSIDMIG